MDWIAIQGEIGRVVSKLHERPAVRDRFEILRVRGLIELQPDGNGGLCRGISLKKDKCYLH